MKIIPDAGHSIKEPGIVDGLMEAAEKYASL
jgi:gamma-glutamyltranspeptidase